MPLAHTISSGYTVVYPFHNADTEMNTLNKYGEEPKLHRLYIALYDLTEKYVSVSRRIPYPIHELLFDIVIPT
jgi:hypothetical protein